MNVKYLACAVAALILGFIVSTTQIAFSQTLLKDSRFYETEAIKFYKIKDYAAFLENMRQAEILRPRHPRLMYNLAVAYALNNRQNEAVGLLERLAAAGLIYPAEKDEDFAALKSSESFQTVIKRFESNKNSVGKSLTALKIPQKGLITESVAFDPKTKIFYLSSIYKRKIIAASADGTVLDFADETDGLWSATGIKIDSARKVLWACSAAHPQMANFKPEENGMSAVFKFDLGSGKLIKKYVLPNQPNQHWLGDLVVAKNGDIYVTDSKTPAVYRIAAEKDELEVFLEGAPFASVQGLDFSDDEKHLFIADYSKGIFVVEMKTKSVSAIESPLVAALGIDGIYFYKNSLIGIQNGTNPQRVVRLNLSKDFRLIKTLETLEANNPLFDEPTLGAIVKNTFYYVANSQWGAIDDKGNLASEEKLQNPVILKINLDK